MSLIFSCLLSTVGTGKLKMLSLRILINLLISIHLITSQKWTLSPLHLLVIRLYLHSLINTHQDPQNSNNKILIRNNFPKKKKIKTTTWTFQMTFSRVIIFCLQEVINKRFSKKRKEVMPIWRLYFLHVTQLNNTQCPAKI